DVWTHRLSEYLDGALSEREAHRLEAHLAACEECRSTLDGLRSVVAEARTLANQPPAADLWPGIAANLEIRAPRTRALPAWRGLGSWRFSLSVPQAVAAGLVLALLSGGTVWMLESRAPRVNGVPRLATRTLARATPAPEQVAVREPAPVRESSRHDTN